MFAMYDPTLVQPMRDELTRAGQPAWLVEHVLEIQANTRAHRETPTSTVQTVTGHPPRRLADFLIENLAAFRVSTNGGGTRHPHCPL